jgi:hypothetical protein
VALAVLGLCYVYNDLRETTRQMVVDQKQASTENLKVVVQAVEAINTNTSTMEEVGEAVNASKQATQEIARDVRELREELRRDK